MREIIIYLLIFWAGGILGFFLHFWLGYRRSYTGTIYISKDDHKTLYSLELEEYPEAIRFKKEVVFKVDSSKFSELSEIDSFE